MAERRLRGTGGDENRRGQGRSPRRRSGHPLLRTRSSATSSGRGSRRHRPAFRKKGRGGQEERGKSCPDLYTFGRVGPRLVTVCWARSPGLRSRTFPPIPETIGRRRYITPVGPTWATVRRKGPGGEHREGWRRPAAAPDPVQPGACELTDGQLLERFATDGGEAAELAFAALVERHGPMVLRVCRGVLRDPNDVEDAFQATFLVLVRKARALWVEDSLGPWLHRVARRIATRAAGERRPRRRLGAARGRGPAERWLAPSRDDEPGWPAPRGDRPAAGTVPRGGGALRPRGADPRAGRAAPGLAGRHGQEPAVPRPRPAARPIGPPRRRRRDRARLCRRGRSRSPPSPFPLPRWKPRQPPPRLDAPGLRPGVLGGRLHSPRISCEP